MTNNKPEDCGKHEQSYDEQRDRMYAAKDAVKASLSCLEMVFNLAYNAFGTITKGQCMKTYECLCEMKRLIDNVIKKKYLKNKKGERNEE